jgi:hypothetical protein
MLRRVLYNEKIYIGKIAKGFDFCGFRLSYDKIILAKSCLAKFEKRLSKLYERLLKSKRGCCKNTFTTTSLFKKIELYVYRFGWWAMVMQQPVIQNCSLIRTPHVILERMSMGGRLTASFVCKALSTLTKH